MKNDDALTCELQTLLDEWCDGTISRQGADRVNELVCGNRRLAWEYLCYMELHGALRCSLDEKPDVPEVRLPDLSPAGSMIDDIIPEDGGGIAPAAPTMPTMPTVPRGLWLPLAAVFLPCLFIALVIWQSWPGADPIANGPIAVAPIAKAPSASVNEVVACLLSTSDCRWKVSTRTIKTGGEFRRGDVLELESGFANIRSALGAGIILRGPARLVLTGPNSVQLDSGSLTSEVPKEAVGFIVETALSRIVDFGTEFGVSAEPGGQTALSVFQGEVEVASRNQTGQIKPKRVFAGQALRIDRSGVLSEVQTVDPQQFGLVCRPSATNKDTGKNNKIIRVDLKRLRSADELRVTGELVVAVNVGGNKSISVGDITFTADDGQLVSSPVKQDPWGTLPWLGNSTDNRALCEVLHSIRYNNAVLKQPGGITIAVPVPNGCYRLRLLLSENHHACNKRFSDRSINVDFEGQPCIRDLRMLAVQGIAGYPVPPTQAILLCCDLHVDDGVLDAVLFSKDVAQEIDPNVILNGLIIERIHPPSGD